MNNGSLTKNQIQQKSDAKRGFRVKSFKLKIEDIAYIEQVAKDLGLTQNSLLIQAVTYFNHHQDHIPQDSQ